MAILFAPDGQPVEVQDCLVSDFITRHGCRYDNPRPIIAAIQPENPKSTEPELKLPENPNLININKAALKTLTDLSKGTIADAKKIIEGRPYDTIESVIAVGGDVWYALRDKISF